HCRGAAGDLPGDAARGVLDSAAATRGAARTGAGSGTRGAGPVAAGLVARADVRLGDGPYEGAADGAAEHAERVLHRPHRRDLAVDPPRTGDSRGTISGRRFSGRL